MQANVTTPGSEKMKFDYVNFKNNVGGSPNLIKLTEINPDKLDKKQNYYVSVFRFNERHKQIEQDHKSVAGIKDTLTNMLLWDIDSGDKDKTFEENWEIARAGAVKLCMNLVNNYNVEPDEILVAFSGSKGFHVSVNLGHDITPEEFKTAVTKIAGDVKVDKTVAHANCMIRVMGTINQKSGLYKIPLTVFELDELDINEIRELAKTPRYDFSVPSKIVTLSPEIFKTVDKKEATILVNADYDYSTPPKGWKKYKWALAQGWFDSGERHNALMVIAATSRGLGYSKEHTYYICKAALKKQSARTGDEEFDKQELFQNIIEDSVFSGTWDGGQYSPDNNPWLKKYCERMQIDVKKDVDNIVQLYHIEEEFVDYVKNIDKNTILTGIPELDEALPLTIGMNLGIIGAASSGKTALSLKILENTSQAGVVSVFASLDMRRNRLYEKLLYRLSGLSRKDLYDKIQKGEAASIFALVREKYKNVYFYDRSCPSVDDIRAYTLAIEEQTGQKVKLVMVDYFERVNAERSDDTAASKEVAGKLQDMVNDLNVCLITLVQPNKFAISGGPDTPILNYSSIKGSSFLYQAFRSIISIWRPFFTPALKDDDRFLQMAILKNDLGELNMFNFGWDGKKGEIWGLGEEGEEELERLMRIKDESRANTGNSGDPWQ